MKPTPLFLAFFFILTWGHLSFAAPQSGKVTVAVGDVKVIPKEGGAGVPLKAGQTVSVGSTVKTGPASRAVIVIASRSAVRISADSEVVIVTVSEDVKPRKITLDLKNGSLSALLKPKAPGDIDFRIKTPSGIAAARGTFYAVAVKDGKSYAQVKEGRVEIIPNSEPEKAVAADAAKPQ